MFLKLETISDLLEDWIKHKWLGPSPGLLLQNFGVRLMFWISYKLSATPILLFWAINFKNYDITQFSFQR